MFNGLSERLSQLYKEGWRRLEERLVGKVEGGSLAISFELRCFSLAPCPDGWIDTTMDRVARGLLHRHV